MNTVPVSPFPPGYDGRCALCAHAVCAVLSTPEGSVQRQNLPTRTGRCGASLGRCAGGEGQAQEVQVERPWGPDAACLRPIRGRAGMRALPAVRVICIPRVHRAAVPRTR